MLLLKKLVVPFFFNVTAAPPCGYTNEKPSRSSALWCKITGLLTHVQTTQKLCFWFIFLFVSLLKYRLSAVSTVSSRCAALRAAAQSLANSLPKGNRKSKSMLRAQSRNCHLKSCCTIVNTHRKNIFVGKTEKRKTKKSWHAVKIMNRSIFLLDKLSIIYQRAFFFSISSIFFLKVSQLSFLPLFFENDSVGLFWSFLVL